MIRLGASRHLKITGEPSNFHRYTQVVSAWPVIVFISTVFYLFKFFLEYCPHIQIPFSTLSFQLLTVFSSCLPYLPLIYFFYPHFSPCTGSLNHAFYFLPTTTIFFTSFAHPALLNLFFPSIVTFPALFPCSSPSLLLSIISSIPPCPSPFLLTIFLAQPTASNPHPKNLPTLPISFFPCSAVLCP